MNYGRKGVQRKKRALNAQAGKWGKKLALTVLEIFLIAFIGIGIIGASAGLGVFKGILATAPDISNIDVSPTGFSTFVYDNQGHQTAKLVATDSNRIPVSMDKIPENLAHAFVAIEDERFYEHNGIDIKGIIRAGVDAIAKGRLGQGASTITQQLLKNSVFTSWTNETKIQSIKRKIQEQYLAIQLTKVMSKDDVLCNYMNTINLGQNTLGVQAASLRYFNKDVSALTLSECAVIASITQNPSRYNPISHPENNAERRDKVLRHMLEQGYISQSEYDAAIKDDVYSRIQVVNAETPDDTVNSYFVDALTDILLDDLVTAGYTETQAYTLLYSGGLKIYSTQDPDIQAIADSVCSDENNFPENVKWQLNYELTIQDKDQEFHNHSSEMFRTFIREENARFNMIYTDRDQAYADIERYKESVLGDGDEVFAEKITLAPQPQISMTIEDQHTGYVVAMVGGRGVKEGSRTFNRATDSPRQPGSTFKVVSTYAPALDSAGLTLATVMNDAPFNYAEGKPVANWYGETYRGLCSLRDGIRDSMNIVTVKTLTQITPQLGYDYLLNFGFTTLVESEPVNGMIYSDIQQSLALGGITKGVKNIELNAAYASIANEGTYIKPKLYTKVLDHDGNVVLDNTVPETKQVLKPSTAFLLTSAMQDVVTSGTGTAVNFGNMAIAGKTGTTSDYNDVWFSGYTPYYTCTTWAGFDNNTKLSNAAEKGLAKTLWRAAMSRIHENLENKSFPVPDGIVTATVCAKSGKLPIAGMCDGHLKTEYFAEGTIPTDSCDVHYSGMVCPIDNLPASDLCPFKTPGVLELLPVEDPSLQSGTASALGLATDAATPSTSTDVLLDEEGQPIQQMATCHHNYEFFSTPDYLTTLQSEIILYFQQGATMIPWPSADASEEVKAAINNMIQAIGQQTQATLPVPPTEPTP